jgi:hypothetical protein
MSAREADLTEVSPAELREAMGHFATGVTVITSIGRERRVHLDRRAGSSLRGRVTWLKRSRRAGTRSTPAFWMIVAAALACLLSP